MDNDLFLQRKWTLRAEGKQVVFVKKSNESQRHVLMKALIWALYLPQYNGLRVEVSIGDRFKPDVVMLDDWQQPLFWGEAGEVGRKKIRKLVRKYPNTHFAMAKWESDLSPYVALVEREMRGVKRSAPFDLLRIRKDSAEKISAKGHINISFDDIEWVRLTG